MRSVSCWRAILPVQVSRETDWHPTGNALNAYDRCPRRFFYTHVLGLKSSRKRTAFTQTHDCLYRLMDWLGEARKGGAPTVAEAESAFEEIWQAEGPGDHAFASDYRALSSRLINVLVEAGAGLRFRQRGPLPVHLGGGRVVVEPDEIVELPGGTVGVRRVRTGYKRSNEYDRLEYALYRLAANEHFGDSAEVLALHLTDGSAEEVRLTPRKLATRQSNSERMLRGIAEGWFPPEPEPVVCARCPHFFICPALPGGPLTVP
ncbi:MAG: PD-(D/E)XK nuclease family protein [Gammaproteobacteria bacterium]|nr:PD-(D/E)XK nuclease family protein [Gammaproteobacteria bacterium]